MIRLVAPRQPCTQIVRRVMAIPHPRFSVLQESAAPFAVSMAKGVNASIPIPNLSTCVDSSAGDCRTVVQSHDDSPGTPSTMKQVRQVETIK